MTTEDPESARVSEKLREDIREIQLQLAGLEVEESLAPSPYRIEVLEDEPEGSFTEPVGGFSLSTEEGHEPLLQTETLPTGLDEPSGVLETEAVTSEFKIVASPELLENIRSIPETMAFKIGEAADLVGVKQYVLRYWEGEFDQLKPKKSRNGQRVYSRRDVETAMMIKKLLYDDRFSIEGARAALRSLRSEVKEEKVIIEQVDKIERVQDSVIADLHQLGLRARAAREKVDAFVLA